MDDLINRQKAIDSLTEIIMNLKNVYGDMGSAVNGARECIKSLPSAEPEQKKGKWIHKEYSIGACYAECNECHYRARGIAEDYGFGFNYKFYNFCPNCGAKME